MRTKQSLRNEIGLLKKRYSNEDLLGFSKQILGRLTQTKQFKEAKCILAYYSFIGEVFTHVLEDAGVFKCTEEGRANFRKFISTL